MQLRTCIETVWLARPITVSRGTYASDRIVVATLDDGTYQGRGECSPIAHYGWSPEAVEAELAAIAPQVGALTRETLLGAMPPGPARNALDCAMWDLEAKRSGRSAWAIAGVDRPGRIPTAMTLMMASPYDMAQQALDRRAFKTLKLKLGRDRPAEALRAVRAARPDAILSIDANEGWTIDELEALYPVMAEVDLAMIEQPLRAGADAALAQTSPPAPFCADESFHSSVDLADAATRYGFVNIKLDKCGGLTEALRILDAAPAYGLRCMVGCMFVTSLGIAPAMIAAARCDFADLDGPLLLKEDRAPAFRVESGAYDPGSSAIWGVVK